jgi:hypothetical protein
MTTVTTQIKVMHVKFRSFEDLGEGKEWAVPPFRAVDSHPPLFPKASGLGKFPRDPRLMDQITPL